MPSRPPQTATKGSRAPGLPPFAQKQETSNRTDVSRAIQAHTDTHRGASRADTAKSAIKATIYLIKAPDLFASDCVAHHPNYSIPLAWSAAYRRDLDDWRPVRKQGGSIPWHVSLRPALLKLALHPLKPWLANDQGLDPPPFYGRQGSFAFRRITSASRPAQVSASGRPTGAERRRGSAGPASSAARARP